MAEAVIMPKQGQSVESCIITQWVKKVGDDIKAGDILFTYETDKAAFECESTAEGTLLAILAKDGDDVPCLDNVCVIGKAGEDISAFIGGDAAPAKAEAAPAQEEKAVEAPAPVAAARKADGSAPVSPRARNAAARMGVDASLAAPTGPEGRIIERDVLALASNATRAVGGAIEGGTGVGGRARTADLSAPKAEQAPAVAEPVAAAYQDKPLSNMRKVIAKAMMSSLHNTAQLTHTVSFDATEILAFRAKCKLSKDPDIAGITIGDMILYAVSRTLGGYEALNANLIDDTTLRVFSDVNLGVAVDTPRGLLVPTVFAADKLSLVEISQKVKELGAAGKAGTINPDLLKGGSFTVSNLGGFGVESFTPVINAPQTGILGVCTTIDAVRMGKNGIEIYKSMPLCLTYDHRAIDGAPATRFLVELKNSLESFSLLLAK